jgi:tetratricopeptide (TPR) repeat protein
MNLRQRINLAYLAFGIVPAALAFAALGVTGVYVAIPWAVLSARLYRRVSKLFVQRANQRLLRAAESEDTAGLRAAIDDFSSAVPAAHAAVFRAIYEVLPLLAEDRFREARTRYDQIDRARLPDWLRATFDNNHAWLLAHTGDAERAVELARGLVASSPRQPLLPFALGTLGASLTLAGRHAEAIQALERSLALGGTARSQAIRRYYLGEALNGLHRFEEAHAAYEACAAVASRYQARARERAARAPSLPVR